MEIERQIELLTDYADANNMEYEVFSEQGSSESWDRPEFTRLRNELKRNLYDGVLVTDQDRISRDGVDFGQFRRLLASEGILFHTLNKTYNFMNADDNFVTGIQAQVDAQFMRITKRKLKRGRIQAIKKGVYFGVAPYGYDKDDNKHLKPRVDEAEVVRAIFDLYVNEGLNQAEIVERITNRGYKTREGHTWTVGKTSFMLDNIAYTGVVHYEMDGEEPIHVENAHEPLVDRETFKKAQEIRKERRIVPQGIQRGVYALSRLIVCQECGQTLSFCMKYVNRKARAALDKDQRELYVLNCHASKSQKAKRETKDLPRCKNNGIKASRIEEAVFKDLERHLGEIDEHIERLVTGVEDHLGKVAKEMERLKKRIAELEAQKKKVQQGFIMEIFTEDEATVEMKAIKEQQIAVQKELDNLDGADVSTEVDRQKEIKRKIKRLLSMEHNDAAQTNRFLHEVINGVYYWKETRDDRTEKPFNLWVDYKK